MRADAAEGAEGIDKVIEGWLRGRYLDGVVQKLRRDFRVLGDAEIERAVENGVEKILKRAGDKEIRNPKGYLMATVRNALLNVLRRLVPDELPCEDDGMPVRRSAEEQFFEHELLELVREKISRWPNEQMATVTMAYIEAGYHNEPIDPTELQQIVLDNLGVELSLTNISTLLNRGRARLIRQLAGLI